MLSIPCQRYIRFVCRVLEIPVPSVTIHENGRFVDLRGNLVLNEPFGGHPGSTVTCEPRQGKLWLDLDKSDEDAYFKMAHALRHIWQERNDWHVACCLDPDSRPYEGLPSEMDADAFAHLITTECFHKTRAGDEMLENVKEVLSRTYSPRYISECLHKTA